MEALAAACLFTNSLTYFWLSIHEISINNVFVDMKHILDKEYHFDDESFGKGHELIIMGLRAVKADINQENYFEARKTLGEIMHTLQVT